MGKASNTRALLPYVPRLILEWRERRPDELWMELDASMLFADVSGFTRMSERLSRLGRVGAEEVSEVIGGTFATLLSEAYAFGGSLVKFGGDALLLLFSGQDHPRRAVASAYGMRSILREMGILDTSSGVVKLRMSVGVHTGTFHFFLVGASHRELIVAGPAASTLVKIQDAASTGQILLSPSLSELLPARNRGRKVGPGVLLSRDVDAQRSDVPVAHSDADLTEFIPKLLRPTVLEGGMEAEHRTVTVAFLRVSGVDGLVEHSGLEVTGKTLQELVVCIQEAADARSVAWLGTDIAGDGAKIILAAGAPSVTGADEEMMLLTLREIVSAEPALPIEIGVHRGSVFAGEIGPYYRRTYTVMGDDVNLAARLMARAQPGQILTTPHVLAGSRTLFETAELGQFFVKGKKKQVQAFVVGEPKGSRSTIAEAGLPLVGREEELRTLLESWESTRTGSGRLVELRAEAGLGKSRLLGEFLLRVEGARLLSAECRLYQASTPYFPFRSLLRQAFGLEGLDDESIEEELEKLVGEKAPELLPWLSLLAVPFGVFIAESDEVAMLEDEFRRIRLEEVVEHLLSAVLTEPVVISLEDIHWMDEASRDLLTRLAHSAAERRWLIVISRRPGKDDFVASEAPENFKRLDLEPLSSEQAADLINTATKDAPLMPHQVQTLAQRAQGNPLFLIELLDALRRGESFEVMPQSVEGLIQARIDRLAPGDRALLRYVSVLGAGFHAEHARAVLPGARVKDGRRVLTRLQDFLFVDSSGWVRFRHALIRDAAYEGLPYRTRQQLHAQVADSIFKSAAGKPEDQAELLSLHYHEAKRWPEAWTYSRIAGDHAKAINANLEAARFYERAAEAGRRSKQPPATEVAAVLESLGDVRQRGGDSARADKAYHAARRLLGDQPVDRARLLSKHAWIRERMGRYTQALHWLRRAQRTIEGLESREAAQQRARFSSVVAGLRFEQGRNAEAIRWSRKAIDEAEAAEDKEASAQAHLVLGLALEATGDPDHLRCSRKALSIYEELGNVARQSVVLNHLGVYAYFEGRWNDAIGFYEESTETGLKAGDPVNAERGNINIGEILSDQGRVEEAQERFDHVLGVWRAAGYRAGVALALSFQGRAASRSGRFEKALELLEEARAEFAEIGDLSSLIEVDARIAEANLFQGLADETLAQATNALERAEELGLTEQAALLHRLRGQSLMLLGRLDEAERALDRSLEIARIRNADFEFGLTLRSMAQLGWITGSSDEAAERQSHSILGKLGVVAIPEVPGLPTLPQPGS